MASLFSTPLGPLDLSAYYCIKPRDRHDQWLSEVQRVLLNCTGLGLMTVVSNDLAMLTELFRGNVNAYDAARALAKTANLSWSYHDEELAEVEEQEPVEPPL